MTTDTQAGETRVLNRRQQAKQRTADTVLRVARGIFETQGYEKATIREIAKAAGMSTGAVFANYQDKAELYAVAFGHPPITPEIGRALMKGLQALQVADLTMGLDVISGIGDGPHARAWRYVTSALELAKAPPVAIVPCDDHGQTVQRFLESGFRDGGAPGAGFAQHVLGLDGERVDVTPVGG